MTMGPKDRDRNKQKERAEIAAQKKQKKIKEEINLQKSPYKMRLEKLGGGWVGIGLDLEDADILRDTKSM